MYTQQMTARISSALLLVLTCVACQALPGSADEAGFGRLHLGIHDDPLVVAGHTITRVLVNVKDVAIHGNSGWIELDANGEQIDLLERQGGLVQWLGATNIPAGDYDRMRLVVSDAMAVIDGEVVALEIPSAESSGIKLQSGLRVGDDSAVWVQLDFDLQESIHQTGNGTWIMHPVVRIDGVRSQDGAVSVARAHDGRATELSLPDGARIIIDDGAVPDGTIVSLERIVDEHGGMNPSPTYEILPSGALAGTATVTLPYYDLPEGVYPQDLQMSVDRKPVPSAVDEASAVLTATIDHFCTLTSTPNPDKLRARTRVRRENDAVEIWMDQASPTPWILARIDLDAPGVTLSGHISEQSGTGFYKRQFVEKLLPKGEADFAVNTVEMSRFLRTPDRTVRIDGETLYVDKEENKARIELRISEASGYYRADLLRSEPRQHGMGLEDYDIVFGSPTTIAWDGGYKDSLGDPLSEPGDDGWNDVPSDYRERRARTIAGITKDGDLILMVIGGRDLSGEENTGVNIYEAYNLLHSIIGDELNKALFFDGGPSTQAVIDDQPQRERSERWRDARKIMTAISVSATCSEPRFTDVHPTDWFYTHVKTLMCEGALDNVSNFHPANAVSRAEFLKANLELAFPDEIFLGLDDPKFSYFADVATDAWYAPYVEFAHKHGIIEGYQVNGQWYFMPGNAVLRSEAAKMVVEMGKVEEAAERYRQIHGYYTLLGLLNREVPSSFDDVSIDDWYYFAVHALKLFDGDHDSEADGIVCGQGQSNDFEPLESMNRAEMAKVLCLASGYCAPEPC